MASLNELRSTAVALERKVGKKISRVKATTGAVIAGSEFDPRKGKTAIAGMRSRDLQAHIRKQEKLLNRSTQFVAGARNVPLPRKEFAAYKRSEQRLVTRAKKELAPLADVKLPGPGTETVGQRQAKMRTKHPTVQNMSYIPPTREPFNIANVKALKELTKNNNKRMTKDWAAKEHQRAMVEMDQMFAVFRMPILGKFAKTMTPGQMDMLWNFTRFADALSLSYHHIKSKYDTQQEIPESVLKDQMKEALSLIKWAKQFDV